MLSEQSLKSMLIENQNNLIVAKYSGGLIEQVSPTRFKAYCIRWHDPNRMDLTGEWFSPKTNRMLKAGYPIIGAPLNYQHGMHKGFGSTGIGLLDFTNEDEIGQFVEGELYTRAEYIEMLKEIGRLKEIKASDSQYIQRADMAVKAVSSLITSVPMQMSGGFDPSTWIVDPETKHIDQSGLIHLALTPTPADDLNPLVEFKSTWKSILELEHERKTFDMKPSIQAEPPTEHKEAMQPKDATVLTDNEERGGGSRKTNDGNLTTMNKESDMDAMEILKQVMAMLQEYLGGMETPLPEDEAQRMTDDIEEELKQELPEDEEVAKMDEADEEELSKSLAKKALALVDAQLAKRKKVGNAAKGIFDRAKDTQLPSPEKYFGGGSGGQKRVAPISVSETLKYAHLSAEDMAMAWKMSVAAAGNLGARGLKGRSATDFVSEDFYRTAMHKMYAQVGKQGLARPHEDMEVKAYMPFKANELDATDITGQGLEWLGYAYDSQVWETARNNYVYQEMMNRGMMEKPVAQGERGAYVPIESDDLTVYGGVEANSVDSTGRPETVYKIQPQTTTTQLVEPGTFRTATAYTFELGEDSFVDMAAEANRKIRIALTENIEKAFINADSDATASTNINKIDGTPTSTGLTKDYYLEFDGLRKSPLVTSTAYSRPGATLSTADYRATWALLGSAQAAHKDNIFFLIDFDTFQASLDLLPVLTKDVAGEQNSLFTGNFESLWGIPVLMSGFLSKSNSAGKISVTPGNNTKGQILAVYAPYWAFVFKRNISIEMQRSPQSESFEFYGSARFGLKRRSASASAITYNLTV